MPELVQKEDPVFSLKSAAICLHFGDEGPLSEIKGFPYPNCPVIRSMEMDLFTYRFQLDPPFGTKCEPIGRQAVELVFPERLEYHSEGRTMVLESSSPVRPAFINLSSTHFLRSGARVWHAVISPGESGSFNEFDLIKLIHLYDGRTEDTRIDEVMRFRFSNGKTVSARELISAALQNAPNRARLLAGTVQVTGGSGSFGVASLSAILNSVLLDNDQGASNDKLATWLNGNTKEGRVIRACCGIVSGILDFDYLDPYEVRDILAPTVIIPDGIIRIHKATLCSISDSDRPMEECRETVGISPYLIIPHAALIHNEMLVEAAERELDAALADKRKSIQKLQEVNQRTERLLNRRCLPNVFDYDTEQSIFDNGAKERGSDHGKTAALAKLTELSAVITRRWEERRDVGQMCIAMLLAVMSVMGLKDLILMKLGAQTPVEKVLGILAIIAVIVAGAIYLLWRRGVRK